MAVVKEDLTEMQRIILDALNYRGCVTPNPEAISKFTEVPPERVSAELNKLGVQGTLIGYTPLLSESGIYRGFQIPSPKNRLELIGSMDKLSTDPGVRLILVGENRTNILYTGSDQLVRKFHDLLNEQHGGVQYPVDSLFSTYVRAVPYRNIARVHPVVKVSGKGI